MSSRLAKSALLRIPALIVVFELSMTSAFASCFCYSNFMPANLGDGLMCYRFISPGSIGKAGGGRQCSPTRVAPIQDYPDPSVVFAADLAAPQTGTSSATDTDTPTGSTGTTDTADEIAQQEISQVADDATGNQDAAIKAAVKAAELGANNRATQGVVLCAAGANANFDSPDSGASEIAVCRDKFTTAGALAKMVAKGGGDGALKPDQNVLNEESSQVTLEKFEKNFGVEKNDFVNRLLASHGSPSELKDLLSSKLSNDRFDQLMSMADEIPPVAFEASKGEILANLAKKPTVSTSLRDSLKKKLAEGEEEEEENRELSSSEIPVVNPPRKPDVYKNLEPANLDGMLNANGDSESNSLSLFDVIRMKLREITAREHL